jgi:hypothetical protein
MPSRMSTPTSDSSNLISEYEPTAAQRRAELWDRLLKSTRAAPDYRAGEGWILCGHTRTARLTWAGATGAHAACRVSRGCALMPMSGCGEIATSTVRYQGVRPVASRASRSAEPLWLSGHCWTCCSAQSAHCRVICASPTR